MISSVSSSITSSYSSSTLSLCQKVSGYNVVFEDTILFPEGGGQNDDHGTIISSNGNECDSDNKEVIPVLRVVRNGDKAVHFLQTNNPLELGTKVKQIVDWERRFDHMQQHTGQHLISALFEKLFKIYLKKEFINFKIIDLRLDNQVILNG